MRDERPTVGSLFAGIGGIDLGLERAGFRTAWFCERDEYCQRVLAEHWPGVPCYPDVRELDEGVERVDLIAAGFPCQPVSIAGRRLVQDDERWLWPHVARLVRLLRPRAVLLENVTGLFTAGFGDVLGDLAALGFDAEWGVLSACAMGAPHTRERVFIVAYPAGRGLQWGGLSGHEKAEPVERAGSVEADHWTLAARPALVRMAHGIPSRVDRLRALGNTVVPQVAEVIGRGVMALLTEQGEIS